MRGNLRTYHRTTALYYRMWVGIQMCDTAASAPILKAPKLEPRPPYGEGPRANMG